MLLNHKIFNLFLIKEKCEGFENPAYKYTNSNSILNAQHLSSSQKTLTNNYIETLNLIDSEKTITMNDLYETLFNDCTSVSSSSKPSLDSPDFYSIDSGCMNSVLSLIADSKPLSCNTIMNTDFKTINQRNNSGSNCDSLYSSMISSVKFSSENLNLNRELSSNSQINDLNKSQEVELRVEEDIQHIEQHQLPVGWIKCCDEDGIYYWHKPSGTVTRRPPRQTDNINIKDLNEAIDKNLIISSSSSTSSSSTSENRGDSFSQRSSPTSSASSLKLNAKSNSNDKSSNRQRFYVRSMGWIKIDEDDLTPEKSSKAVNKCINDLSRGLNDFNDSVARWGEVRSAEFFFIKSYFIFKY